MRIFKDGSANGSKKWAFMERFEIPNLDRPEETYLTRWRIIQTPLFAIYVHRMDGPDSRDTLHDHPWDFLSIILRGGYIEMVPVMCLYDPNTGEHEAHACKAIWRNASKGRRFNRKRAEDLHVISELTSTRTWTLVLTGPRKRTWGYLDSDGTWTPYNEHFHSIEWNLAMDARQERATA
jgi:hypothetical protein